MLKMFGDSLYVYIIYIGGKSKTWKNSNKQNLTQIENFGGNEIFCTAQNM